MIKDKCARILAITALTLATTSIVVNGAIKMREKETSFSNKNSVVKNYQPVKIENTTKNGDTKTINEVTYVFEDGYWHIKQEGVVVRYYNPDGTEMRPEIVEQLKAIEKTNSKEKTKSKIK